MIAVALRLLAVYLLLVVFLYFAQRFLQYHPDTHFPGSPAANGVPKMHEVIARTEDGLDLLAWFAPPREKGGKIVVFFHGNAGHIGHRAVKARYFLDKGYGVYMCEYRGYGGNKGSISEEGLYRDGRGALMWLREQGYKPAQFVLYGESIGAAVAIEMATQARPSALILESPFNSAVAMGEKRYFYVPVSLLLKDRFDNLSKIGRVHAPLLVVHGDEDATTPIAFARELFNAANHPKEFIDINGGGHSDLYEHHAGHLILEWLGKQP